MKIVVDNVTKVLKGVTVLENVSYEFTGGNIYGIVGKNGCGKTMLMRAICGLIKPTEGKILIDDKELHKDISFPPNIGIIIEKPEFLGYLSGFENLKRLAEINNKVSDKEIRDYMKMFSLNPDSKLHMRKYSLGMKQKIGIIQAIMENPDYLILDEPFNAIDEETVKMVHKLLLDYKKQGKLIIVTSHHKEDIDTVCDHVVSMQEGKIKS